MAEGVVYVLTNEAMPGYVKIGRTESIERRLLDLDWTNIPLPFECFHAAKVADASFVEAQLHEAFGDHRVRAKREFFRISPERVVAALRLAAIEDVTPRADVAVSDDVRHDLEEARARKAVFNFDMVKIPVGAVLTFSRDPNVTAKVSDARHVTLDGAEMSVSDAALRVLKRQGVVWKSVQGPLFWKYEGETLDERRRRMEEGAEG
jgi:hypothetical protein